MTTSTHSNLSDLGDLQGFSRSALRLLKGESELLNRRNPGSRPCPATNGRPSTSATGSQKPRGRRRQGRRKKRKLTSDQLVLTKSLLDGCAKALPLPEPNSTELTAQKTPLLDKSQEPIKSAHAVDRRHKQGFWQQTACEVAYQTSDKPHIQSDQRKSLIDSLYSCPQSRMNIAASKLPDSHDPLDCRFKAQAGSYSHAKPLPSTITESSKQVPAIHQRPNSIGKPQVWAETRQELCEGVPYFRSYQSGLYMHNNVNDLHLGTGNAHYSGGIGIPTGWIWLP